MRSPFRFSVLLSATALQVIIFREASSQRPGEGLQLHDLPRTWLSAGVGVGSGAGGGYDGSLGASLSFVMPSDRYLGQIAFNGNRPVHTESNLPYAAAVSFGLGRAWATYDFAFAGFVGPAVTWGRERARDMTYRTAGLMLGSQFFVTPTLMGGLGLDAFAFLHPEHSFLGVRMAIQIGSARSPDDT